MTKTMHQLNLENLKKYLVENVKVSTTISNADFDIKQFNEGQSNPTFYIKCGSKEMVLRKKPAGKLLKGAHQIDREFRVMKAVHMKGFPVPQMLHYCSDADIIGTEFYLMEFVPGRVLMPLMHSVDPKERLDCMLNASSTLAKLHGIDPAEIGLEDFGKKTGFCRRVLSTWTKQYQAAAHKIIPEMHQLIDWLEMKLPEISDDSSIVHGDYSMFNIMFHPQQNNVQAVLDWELSTIGHPLMDFAYLCLPYYGPHEYFLGLLKYNIDIEKLVPELPPKELIIQHYCRIRGLSYPIPNWNFFLALNLFKLASITQGVYARHLQGNASNSAAALFGEMVEPLVRAALKLTQSEMSAAPAILSPSAKGRETLKRVKKFVKENVDPIENEYFDYLRNAKDRFTVVPVMEKWKTKAKAAGLWNLFLPGVSGLSNVDYAHIAEVMGRSLYSEIFNCSAPDTGNMEVLHMYGDDYQKRTWLQPLLDGKIRSAFCMTEPDVASSDATNMQLTITRDRDHYVVNGRKWWSSGAADPRCSFGIVMGKTGSRETPIHRSHSMIIVPFDTPGVTRIRNLSVFGYDDAPHGHSEMEFDNVRVPRRNLILGEGRGFEIAQGRLGPGRIHHCMRSIGMAERCMEMMMKRAAGRRPFGKRILEHQVVQHQIAECRIAIDQCRLLTLHAAFMIDQHGTKKARKEIAMIKVAAPRMLCMVADRAIQIHGGAGVSDDFPLAAIYTGARTLRLADGPDEVHLSSVAKMEIRDQIRKAKL